MKVPDGGVVKQFAEVSDDERYRYTLGRLWDDRPPVLFVGLNPSTADATSDDPTIRRCIRFARDWKAGGLLMGNLFAFRSTSPRALRDVTDPVGPDNDVRLRDLADQAGIVVAAWGVHGALNGRAEAVVQSGVLGSFAVLGLTKDGHPRHPLYIRADQRPLNPLTLEPHSGLR